MSDHVCPECGFFMRQQFDDVLISDDGLMERLYAVPNGKYECYHCGIEIDAPERETKP